MTPAETESQRLRKLLFAQRARNRALFYEMAERGKMIEKFKHLLDSRGPTEIYEAMSIDMKDVLSPYIARCSKRTEMNYFM